MGLRRLITEFLWPPSSSIIRPWLPYSIKVLVKTNQTSPNSMGLRRLITEFPFQLHQRPFTIYQSTVKTNRAQTRWVRLITEFLWPPSSSINRPGYHIVSKYSSRRIKRAQTRWGCVV
ncbi:hypothetical protein EVAR_18244_1 [Eumeta japonica]|uniref:Uncharacterized protein n=1 Tax=Eumeta variegata TaxID=151549 RepID=A0A4C1UKI9_EUMVA|nr:hypothetical protein EVAR_18244_1 [Eumeta japonica]